MEARDGLLNLFSMTASLYAVYIRIYKLLVDNFNEMRWSRLCKCPAQKVTANY